MKVLLVDNYDSFTYNLAHLFGRLGAEVDVVRNDDAWLDERAIRQAPAVVIGPGPGRPREAGKTMLAVGWCAAARKPLFGVCLGQQAIGEYFGCSIEHAPRLMHGKTSPIKHDGSGVFAGVPAPFDATRYHSLCVAHHPFPADLRVNAASDDGVIQGLMHRTLPIHAVQFHPESVLTLEGHALFSNFLAIARGER